MKRGDFVKSRWSVITRPPMTGIVIRVFEVHPFPGDAADPLPMVLVATKNGAQYWKRRKLEVINEY